MLYSPMATIKVRRAQEYFHIHQDLLTVQSAYFQRLFHLSRRRHTSEPITCLFSPTTFRYFVAWLYTGAAVPVLSRSEGDIEDD